MKILHILFLVTFYLLFFQNFIQNKIPFMGNLDEFLAFAPLYLIIIIIMHKRKKMSREIMIILLCVLVIFFLGILGSILYKYQDLKYALYDALITFKFIFAFLFATVVFEKYDCSKYSKSLNLQIQMISLILFGLTLVNFFLNIFPYYDYRMGFKTQQLFFSHPTYLASSCIVLLTFLTAFLEKNKVNYMYIAMVSFVVLATGRTKAIAFVAAYFLLLYIIINGKKIKLRNLIIIASIMFLISFNRMQDQIFVNVKSPRSLLYLVSYLVARDHFPVGSGFGSFASNISGKHYSLIYYKYHLNLIYGLTKKSYIYISDTFWPMILGQLGVFGLILFVILLVLFLRIIFKERHKDKFYFLAALMPFVYLIITSTSESSFANYMAVNYFFIIGIMINRLRLIADKEVEVTA